MTGHSLTDRTFRGLAWAGSGTGLQGVLQLTVLAVLARLLTPEDFGVVGAALIVVGFSAVFSRLGIAPAIVQRPGLTERHVHTGVALSLLLSVAVGGAVFASAPLVAGFFDMPDLRNVVAVLAIIFPIKGLATVADALLQREMRFRTQALVELASYGVGYGAVGIALAATGAGVWALVGANLGKATCQMTILLSIRRDVWGLTLGRKEASELLNFGAGFSLARLANYAANQGDNLVVGRVLGAEPLGVYGRAYHFMMMPVTLLGSVSDKVVFPVMASVQSDVDRLRRGFVRSSAALAMATLPLSAFLLVMAPEVVAVLLGPQWTEVVLPLQILSCVLALRTGYKLGDSLARAKGAVYRRAWRQWIYAVAVFLGAGIGHFWGVAGVALGVAGAIVLNFALMLDLSLRLLGGGWPELLRVYLRQAAVAAVVGVALAGYKAAVGPETLPALASLVAAGTVALGVFGLLWRTAPNLFGEEGVWAEGEARRYLAAFRARATGEAR